MGNDKRFVDRMSANSQPKQSAPKPQERDTLKTEIEQIRRIVNGANKRLEKLSEQLKDK